MEEVELIGADVLGSQAIRRGAKVLRELGDVTQIPIDRVGRVVAYLQVFEHASTQGGHGADDLHEVTPRVLRDDEPGVALLSRYSHRGVIVSGAAWDGERDVVMRRRRS